MTATLPKPQLNALLTGAHSVCGHTDEALFAACGVRVAFMQRAGGVSEVPYASLNTGGNVEDDPACVQRNRALVLDALGCADVPLIVPKQVHGTDIVNVAAANDVTRAVAEAAAGADAVLVEAAGIAALLNFADCLPLILVAPSGRFAVVHAGWRGAQAGIAGKAARELAAAEAGVDGEADVRTAASLLNAYIGPHIHVECFETSAEIAAQFAERYGDEVLADARHVDLARVVAIDLARAGVAADRIADVGQCTVCNIDRYFSYRAEGVTGRHAAVAVRK